MTIKNADKGNEYGKKATVYDVSFHRWDFMNSDESEFG
jgi:hypothetical protein